VGVTSHAISFHVRRIYEKLHVHSRTEAVAKALRSGLFD
jgi:DNA-binding CsgD family transcriptional regulator